MCLVGAGVRVWCLFLEVQDVVKQLSCQNSDCVTRSRGVWVEFHPAKPGDLARRYTHTVGPHSTEASRWEYRRNRSKLVSCNGASVHLSDLIDGQMAWWLRVTTIAGVASPSLIRKTSTARLKS